MPVRLNDAGNPLAWSTDERLDGEDIPCPPDDLVNDPDRRVLWDRENEEWIADPDYLPPQKYIVRRTAGTDYQLEEPGGTVLLSTTYETPPSIPEDIAEDIVTYAESNGDGAMHELRKMMLVGFRYVDSRP